MRLRFLGLIVALVSSALWTVAPVPAVPAHASFLCPALPNYASFHDSGCLTFNGNDGNTGVGSPTITSSGALELTDGGTPEARTAFYSGANQLRMVDLTSGFSTQFTFNVQLNSGFGDGFAFIIQNDTAGPKAISGVGGGFADSFCSQGSCTGIQPGVAIEFDTFNNAGDATVVDDACDGSNGSTDTKGQHVAVFTNGNVKNESVPVCTPISGQARTATIDYSGSALTVSIDGAQILTYPVNLQSLIGNTGYVGFGAGTGTYTDTVDIQSWYFQSIGFLAGEDGSDTWGGTSANPLSISGTAHASTTVNLYGTGDCSGTALGSTTSNASGKWSTSVTNMSSEGNYNYSAAEVDATGAITHCSGGITVNADRTTPTSAVTTPALGANAVYLDGSRWQTSCDAVTGNNVCGTAADSGSGVAAVFVAIENSQGQFWNGSQTNSAFNTTGTWVEATGTTSWSLAVPLPPDDTYTVASAAIDNAGNVQQIFQQSLAGLCIPTKTEGTLSLNGGQLSINGGLCAISGTNGTTPFSGTLSLNGGQLSLNGGSLSLNGGTLSLNGGSLSLNGGTCTLRDSSGNSTTYTLSPASPPAPVTLDSAGGTLSLNGGSLSLNGGQLSLNGGQLTNASGTLSLNGGSLPLNGGGCTVTDTSNHSGTLSLNGGSLSLNGGQLSLNGGQLSLNGGSLSLNGGQLSLNGGQLSLNGGTLSLNGGAGGSANTGNVVIDNTNPVVSSFEVDGQSISGAHNINPSATLHIHFSKPMLSSSVNSMTITGTGGSSTASACDTGDPTCQNASFTGLQPKTSYTITVTSGVMDSSSNPIIGTSTNPTTFSFTTAAIPPVTGTSANDSDGDAIPNAWDGTTTPTFTQGTQTTNTAAWGFNSGRKDLCLVESYMSGTAADGKPYDQHITQAANQAIVNAFANAPVSNPNGTTGVHVVIFEGPSYSAGLPAGYSGPYFGGQITMTDPLGKTSGGSFNWAASTSNTLPSFDDIRKAQFQPTGLTQFCHYAVIAHTLGGSLSSGSSRGIGAGDLVVALGGTVKGLGVGTQQEQEGTVMHELGHNLNLHHGGGRGITDLDVNNKPNYMSVMNYLFQFGGVPGGFTSNGLDYSHGTMISTGTLSEGTLVDSAGIPGASLPGGSVFGTEYLCASSGSTTLTQKIVANATQPINWSCASPWSPTGGSHAADINGDGSFSGVLHDFNDWANLDFKKGDIGFGVVPPPLVESPVDVSPDQGGGVDDPNVIESRITAQQVSWTGFFPPLNAGTAVNTGKAGRTYPVKFQLKDATGNYFTWLDAITSITVSGSNACSAGASDPIDYSTTATSGLHYDTTANQYVYNWATPSTPGCYMLTIKLMDGTTKQAAFSLS